MAIALSAERAVERTLRPLRRPLRPRDAHRRARRARRRCTTAARRTRPSGRSSRRCSRSSSGRPSPLTRGAAPRRARPARRVLLKREDLNHTGAHKINNTVGQALLARRMGKRRIIAETGAGQHGVATATVCARFGLECVVYMGEEDMRAPGAQRLPHAAPRRHGGPGRVGHPHAQGRHQRGDPRLGHQRRRHALHHRLGGRARPVSRAWCATSSRSSAARRARRCSSATGGCRTRWWRASAAARTRWGSSPASSTTPTCELVGVEAAGEGLDERAPQRHAQRAARPACCTAA